MMRMSSFSPNCSEFIFWAGGGKRRSGRLQQTKVLAIFVVLLISAPSSGVRAAACSLVQSGAPLRPFSHSICTAYGLGDGGGQAAPATRACLAAAQQGVADVVPHLAAYPLQVLAPHRSTLWVVGGDQSPDVCSAGHVRSLPGL
jgi:hypothetical protein